MQFHFRRGQPARSPARGRSHKPAPHVAGGWPAATPLISPKTRRAGPSRWGGWPLGRMAGLYHASPRPPPPAALPEPSYSPCQPVQSATSPWRTTPTAVATRSSREVWPKQFQGRVAPGRAVLRQAGTVIHRLEKCLGSDFTRWRPLVHRHPPQILGSNAAMLIGAMPNAAPLARRQPAFLWRCRLWPNFWTSPSTIPKISV